MKREHELKILKSRENKTEQKALLSEKGSRSAEEVAQKWNQIKLLRNMDVSRIRTVSDTKLMTNQDWMIASLLVLNKQ